MAVGASASEDGPRGLGDTLPLGDEQVGPMRAARWLRYTIRQGLKLERQIPKAARLRCVRVGDHRRPERTLDRLGRDVQLVVRVVVLVPPKMPRLVVVVVVDRRT